MSASMRRRMSGRRRSLNPFLEEQEREENDRISNVEQTPISFLVKSKNKERTKGERGEDRCKEKLWETLMEIMYSASFRTIHLNIFGSRHHHY